MLVAAYLLGYEMLVAAYLLGTFLGWLASNSDLTCVCTVPVTAASHVATVGEVQTKGKQKRVVTCYDIT